MFGIPTVRFETKHKSGHDDIHFLDNLLHNEDNRDDIPDLVKRDNDDSDLEDDTNEEPLLHLWHHSYGSPWESDYESFSCDEDSDDDDDHTLQNCGTYDNDHGRSDGIPPLQSQIDSTQQYSAARLREAVEDVDDLLPLQSNMEHFRNERYEHTRLDWNTHVVQLMHEDTFVNEYTMSLHTHQHLREILEPYIFP